MSGIRHSSAGLPVHPTAETTPFSQEPESPAAETLVPAGAAAKLRSMIDEVERLVGDPVLARNAIRVELSRRDSHHEESEPPVESGRDDEQAGPAHPEQTPRPRRVFAGFDRERATYERLKPELLDKAEGKFVVIVGDEVVGPLETDEEAARAGYQRFGLGYLYIKQILAEEPVVVLPFGVVPCRI